MRLHGPGYSLVFRYHGSPPQPSAPVLVLLDDDPVSALRLDDAPDPDLYQAVEQVTGQVLDAARAARPDAFTNRSAG